MGHSAPGLMDEFRIGSDGHLQPASRLPESDGIHGRMCGQMGIDQATDLVRETLTLALVTAAPLLGIGLERACAA